MQKTFLILIVVLTFVCLSAAQETTLKQIKVSSQDVASQANDKPYMLDLSRGGTVYHVEEDVDLSRIQVRTPSELIKLTDLAKQAGRSGTLLVGQTGDVLTKDLHLNSAARQTGYSCGTLACKCRGFGDCFRMGQDGACKGITVCNDTGCTCWKLFSRPGTRGSR